ncbi:MAG: AAA family ATPase, partial [Candidatus Eiseniibacteriota bacterium]
MAQPTPLDLRLLGDLELVRDGEPVPLPPSRKTRALLAYLVASARPHRRERLCEIFWDVADDPRAALRWSLSKLRPLVDEPDRRRIVADRSTVAFDAEGVRVDLVEVREELRGLEHAAGDTRRASDRHRDGTPPGPPGNGRPSTGRLEQLATLFRGEFLEGLELPDYQEFQAWCMAEREAARTLRTRLLATLVERLSAEPVRAIPYARRLAMVDPYDTAGHVTLLGLELARGHRRDAERHLELAGRLLVELGPEPPRELRRIWRELLAASERAMSVTSSTVSTAVSTATPATPPDGGQADGDPLAAAGHTEVPGAAADLTLRVAPLVGRRSERGRLLTALDMTRMRRRAHVVLLQGEPGIGKSRLLAEVIAEAQRRGATVLHGVAYEAESGRPYGPWIDALRGLHPTQVGSTLGAELALLLPELSLRDGRDDDGSREPDDGGIVPGERAVPGPDERGGRWAHAADDHQRHGRDRLFGAVSELVAARAHSAPPVVVVLDDVQWCDDASAELLHYVIRMSRHRSLLVALAARSGELGDNDSMRRVIRGLRRDRSLEELAIGPLTSDETASLLESIAPGVDPARIFEQTTGNPLFAIEFAR